MSKKKKVRPVFCNAVVFAEVMKDPEICRRLIERILPGKKVKELRFVKEEDEFENAHTVREILVKEPETEKTITVGLYAKSIRLDVLFEGENEWYNIEMQVEDERDSPKRSRYYHAVEDVIGLKPGQPYNALKPGYVIFICMFDLFKLGAPIYEFEMYDVKKGLKLNDEQVTIFLNGTCCENVPEEL